MIRGCLSSFTFVFRIWSTGTYVVEYETAARLLYSCMIVNKVKCRSKEAPSSPGWPVLGGKYSPSCKAVSIC